MAPPRVLVLDASPLNHFARVGELETLRILLKDHRCVTTKAVQGELRKGAAVHPGIGDALDLDWVEIVNCDELDELYLFSQYLNRLGNLLRNAGEASVLAWAEAHGAAAYVDDQVACNAGRARGITVHRTLQLVIAAVKGGHLSEPEAKALVADLAAADSRFPAPATEDLFAWARSRNPPLL
jgi:predicted nucleic acid-binding protein